MPYKRQTRADLVTMSHVCFLLEAFRHQGKSLNTSSASCLRCPPGQFSFIPHKVDFKESLSRGLMLQIEFRLNRSARATRAQWFCWVFLPRAKHVVQPGFTLPFNSQVFQAHFINSCFTDGKKSETRRSKRTERGSTESELRASTSLSFLLHQDVEVEKEPFFISVRSCKTVVRSTVSEIPMTWDSSLHSHVPNVGSWASCFTSLSLCSYM